MTLTITASPWLVISLGLLALVAAALLVLAVAILGAVVAESVEEARATRLADSEGDWWKGDGDEEDES